MSTPASSVVLTATPTDHAIARWAALAVALSLVDASLPTPLPGLKPGLANIVTLVVLMRFGMGAAVSVSLLRLVATGLVLGSLFTPGFFLSLAGGISSLAALTLAWKVLPKAYFGGVGLSLLAAFAHLAGQFALVRFWLIPTDGIFYLIPPFAAVAWLTGLVNGLVATHLLRVHFLERPPSC